MRTGENGFRLYDFLSVVVFTVDVPKKFVHIVQTYSMAFLTCSLDGLHSTFWPESLRS